MTDKNYINFGELCAEIIRHGKNLDSNRKLLQKITRAEDINPGYRKSADSKPEVRDYSN